MSISDPIVSTNPATKFIEWSGSKGVFKYYNKDTQENIQMKSLKIIVIDQLSTVCGFHSESESGIYSNEIHSIKEELTVKPYKGAVIAKGLYSDIKATVKESGGKYARSVYAGLIIADKIVELVNVKFFGSSLNGYIEAKVKDGDILNLESSTEVLKKGATKYFVPNITKETSVPVALIEEAKLLDQEKLKPYFKGYKGGETTPDDILDEMYDGAVPEIDLGDFEV